jgi:hypothetical protein
VKKEINTKFGYVIQNNARGIFDFNEEYGIGHYLIIECLDVNDFENRFECIINSYPNRGPECSCCGARWSTWLDENELTDEPSIYGNTDLSDYKSDMFSREDHMNICIHYIDGTKKWM